MPEDNPNNPNNPQKVQNQINIELPEEIAEGVYCNLAVISHTNTEFIVDFIKMLPGTQKAKVKSRVLLSPLHAKRLMRALSENVKKYEAQNGAIKEPNNQDIPPLNFGGPPAQA